jgi:Zn-dependent protease with chaperone function
MSFQAIASIGAERLLFSLGVGTLLAVVVWLLLRVLPRKDSRTSFAAWFATLLITAILPVSGLVWSHSSGEAARSAAVITISATWAMYIFIAWLSLALIGLLRVGVALWQVHRLRSEATPLDPEQLGPGLGEVFEQFKLNPTLCQPQRVKIVRVGNPAKSQPCIEKRSFDSSSASLGVAQDFACGLPPSQGTLRVTPAKRLKMGHPGSFLWSRSVELRVSKRLEVPTAIGFFKPAIVLPEWLLEETPAEELKYIILHELEHLRRRDDWTNLAQQIVKALLFFVPSVWWIERRLALDREMACDDAVLAHSGTPHGYAECLARVAERSFLRRQLALAQAAVSRLRQLTVRVAKILDPNRPQPSRMWRPAVPAVVVVAGLCVFTASQGPELIGFADGSPAAQTQSMAAGSLVPNSAGARTIRQTAGSVEPKMVQASLKTLEPEQGSKARGWNAAYRMSSAAQQKSRERKRATYTLTNLHVANKIGREPMTLARLNRTEPEYVTVRQELMIVVTQRGEAIPVRWQMQVVEIRMTQAKPQKQNPQKI